MEKNYICDCCGKANALSGPINTFVPGIGHVCDKCFFELLHPEFAKKIKQMEKEKCYTNDGEVER